MTKKDFIEIAHMGDLLEVIDNAGTKWYFSFFKIVDDNILGTFKYHVETAQFYTKIEIYELFNIDEIKYVKVLNGKNKNFFYNRNFYKNQ